MAEKANYLKLYRGWSNRDQYVCSPFVIKLEARLRFAGVVYGTEAGSSRTAANGEIPYVEFPASNGDGSVRLGDSMLIIKKFVEMGFLPDLNGHLSIEDSTRDLATRALLEDKLYFCHVRERWIDNYYTMRDYTLAAIPWPLRILVGPLIYRGSKAMLYGQGTLRSSDAEMRAIKLEIWESISSVLSSVRSKKGPSRDTKSPKPVSELFWFLGGDHPTEVDATLFGYIVSVLLCAANPESREIVDRHPILTDYAERIHQVYFRDYERWECHAE
ncbi:hypothetical protein N0V93_006113 [Gnomoniopsis smithogilvyi]|uniref:Glutathione S-transferase n=1 Tax=Gnomoniopsis smithogilvyi TaxID=1191159 RepID=A0A9W9CUF3_9PEZI|nr:hypothetical protein N0V93_006113 [Gnomoniopsis smithogilvyi]